MTDQTPGYPNDEQNNINPESVPPVEPQPETPPTEEPMAQDQPIDAGQTAPASGWESLETKRLEEVVPDEDEIAETFTQLEDTVVEPPVARPEAGLETVRLEDVPSVESPAAGLEPVRLDDVPLAEPPAGLETVRLDDVPPYEPGKEPFFSNTEEHKGLPKADPVLPTPPVPVGYIPAPQPHSPAASVESTPQAYVTPPPSASSHQPYITPPAQQPYTPPTPASYPTAAPVADPDEKPGQITLLGILILVGGLANILIAGGITISVIVGTFGVGLLCLPVLILPAVLAVFEIIYSLKLLGTNPGPVKPNQTLAILEIVSILFGNVFSLAAGIVGLIFYNDPKVKSWFARTGSNVIR